MLLTSPRLPPGLLTRDAWRALEDADEIATADRSAALASALAAGGLAVSERPDASADALVGLAGRGRNVVWVADDDGDPRLVADLAAHVVRRSEGAGEAQAGVEVEVEMVVGSFDPVGARLLDAVTVMDTLRRECPWDREQTHESLVPYLVEETYEVIEAIEAIEVTGGGGVDEESSGAGAQLQEELGDLLLQVLFHARLAEEGGESGFGIDDVAAGLVDKLVRRHPHVFADTEVACPAEVATNWEQIKRAEKGRRSAVDGIPLGLPALSLADSVLARTRPAGRPPYPLETPDEPDEPGSPYTLETLGDALLALVVAARACGLDAEQALRARVRREIADVRAAESPPT